MILKSARIAVMASVGALGWLSSSVAAAQCADIDLSAPNAAFCTPECPCDVGEGDCDTDNDCAGSLVCTTDRGPKYGLPVTYDVCEPPISGCPAYDPDRPSDKQCTTQCPCDVFQGDCDQVAGHCPPYASCIDNVGARHGLPKDYDVCYYPPTPTNIELGRGYTCPGFNLMSLNESFCTEACPCGVGEGDCDTDAQCMPGMVCNQNNGKGYGLPSQWDVCELKRSSCPPFNLAFPSSTQCTRECPCLIGQGHCDNDAECFGNLVCGTDNGEHYGLPSDYRACELPSPRVSCPAFSPSVASATFCTYDCPCGEGEGGCTLNLHCAGGLVCKNDAGAAYGLSADLNVCVAPTATTAIRPDLCFVDFADLVRQQLAQAATQMTNGTITPAHYLAVNLDRNRKLRKAEADSTWACAADTDQDLVPNTLDNCPGTPALTPTTDAGCTDNTLPAAPSGTEVRKMMERFGVPAILDACAGITSLEVPVFTYRSAREYTLLIPDDVVPAACPMMYQIDIILADGAYKRYLASSFADTTTAPFFRTFLVPGWRPELPPPLWDIKKIRARALLPTGVTSPWTRWLDVSDGIVLQ